MEATAGTFANDVARLKRFEREERDERERAYFRHIAEVTPVFDRLAHRATQWWSLREDEQDELRAIFDAERQWIEEPKERATFLDVVSGFIFSIRYASHMRAMTNYAVAAARFAWAMETALSEQARRKAYADEMMRTDANMRGQIVKGDRDVDNGRTETYTAEEFEQRFAS